MYIVVNIINNLNILGYIYKLFLRENFYDEILHKNHKLPS